MDDILQIFFQECDEQLQELERGLTLLSEGTTDIETINAIFRTVHSIKGGASSFGLDNLVHFSHMFENTLDGLRSNHIAATPSTIDIFLKAMDVLSDLVTEAQNGPEVSPDRVKEAQDRLADLLPEEKKTEQTDNIPDDFIPVSIEFDASDFDFSDLSPSDDTQTSKIIVSFLPRAELYQRGDDARNILIGLQDLVSPENPPPLITCDCSKLPELEKLSTEQSYLSWEITLPNTIAKESISSVFDWVNDACEFSIEEKQEEQVSPEREDNAPISSSEIETSQEDFGFFEPLPIEEEKTTSETSVEEEVPSQEEEKKTLPLEKTQEINTPSSPQNAVVMESASKNQAPPQHRTEQISIRVDLQRIDNLMDLVGELIITQAVIESINQQAHSPNQQRQLMDSISGMQSLTRDIQDAVMAVRTQPVRSVFQRMRRVVRETSTIAEKSVNLILVGEDTEVDRTLLEKLTDPLTHMLRNAIDHGIEKTEEQRISAGKTPEGNITLSASHRSGRILITIEDDGNGINHERVLKTAIKRGILHEGSKLSEDEINELIFAPGFSTATTVSDLSGRGVGMDVVKQAILSLGGRISVKSVKGKGTSFSLSLPLTLAVLDGMLIVANGSTMVVPVPSIVETMIVKKSDIYALPDGTNVVSIRGNFIPLVHLGKTLNIGIDHNDFTHKENIVVLIVENESGTRAALLVDSIQTQAQVVIKSMEKNYRQIHGVSAATILGDGSVALILDIPALISSSVARIDSRTSLSPHRLS